VKEGRGVGNGNGEPTHDSAAMTGGMGGSWLKLGGENAANPLYRKEKEIENGKERKTAKRIAQDFSSDTPAILE